MHCLIDEKDMIHNAAKRVPRNVVIGGKKTSVKSIEMYKRVLEAQNKNDAVIDDTFNTLTIYTVT